ncbi:MAG: hypothetical protein P8K83_05290 [Woeseiaceae bacterium]|nr:hypothetical protein [Woeseiaceae bacterium]
MYWSLLCCRQLRDVSRLWRDAIDVDDKTIDLLGHVNVRFGDDHDGAHGIHVIKKVVEVNK